MAIVAAKLATKAGDGEGGWAAAERARLAAESAEDAFGLAAAAYQRACALLRTGNGESAEQLAVSAADDLRSQDPQSVTWRGALTLISAVIAARRNDSAVAGERLEHADELAQWLGADGNIGWTACGPTNVLIHRTSVALNDPRGALATAEYLDITALPVGLNGRQAQFHLDSAWAHAQLMEDPQAVIHLLETERVAPELVRANPKAWPQADSDPASTAPMVEFAGIWRDMPKIVYSRTLREAGWNTTIVRGVVVDEVLALKAEPGGDFALGGPDLAATFLRHDLIDEFHVYVHPILIGRGRPLFPDTDAKVGLQHIGSRTFGNGVVLLRYQR